MSAYIVDKKHILYLVNAAQSRRINHGSTFSWCCGEKWKRLNECDPAEVANALWLENIKSVSHRYPGDKSSSTLPGPVGGSFLITDRDFKVVLWDDYEPAQVLKACACYEYQSCEHEDWETSEAHAFIRSLIKRACQAIVGYEEAAWGAPKTIAEARAEYRSKAIH